jgi:hypothetical protein
MGPKSAKIQSYIVFTPLALAIASALVLHFSHMILFAIGFALFFIAKRSVHSQGTYFSFGPSRMTFKMKRFYWSGYAIMTVAVVINAADFVTR